MKIFLSAIIFISLGLMGCRLAGDKKKILPLDTMKIIMWDMLKADEWYIRETIKDSTLKNKHENIRLYEQVFAIHGITRNQFYASYKYYESHPTEFKVLIDSVETSSNRIRNNLFNKYPGQSK